MKIDTSALRDYLRDYFGSAAYMGFPMEFVDVANVDTLSPKALCQLAIEEGIDLSNFESRD